MADDRFFFGTADTTPETVHTNVTGQVSVIETITMAQGSSGLATVIRLSIGVDGTTTRVFEWQVPAGVYFNAVHVNIKLEGTETAQLSSTVTDDVVVVTINGAALLDGNR